MKLKPGLENRNVNLNTNMNNVPNADMKPDERYAPLRFPTGDTEDVII